MEYDDAMDAECIKLCDAINKLDGIYTTESCCGHDNHSYRIWFKTYDLDFLPPLLYFLAFCHNGFSGWSAGVHTDCAMSPVSFFIEGPKGKEAYEQAEEIAELIENHILSSKQEVNL